MSLVVGGVGVANAAQGFVERKRATLATLKAIGATGTSVVVLALIEFASVALIGSPPASALGAAVPIRVDWLFGALMPFPLAPSIYPGELALGLVYRSLDGARVLDRPAGPRARPAGLRAVPRSRRGAQALAPPALPRRRGACAAAALGRPRRRHERASVGRRHRRGRRPWPLSRAAPRRAGRNGARAPCAAVARRRMAHGARQHS